MNPKVRVWTEDLQIPTYLPAAPDKNPMFLEKRVYQGSSGKVYPLPFTDRVAETPVNRQWKAVWIENEFLRAMVLPELGGRIHLLQDKTNGYHLIYNQSVIKPALVGLVGPWVSGGIEFNWPQHHRPATFLPVDVEIEKHSDGSVTVWCSDHDPMCRMKGMHGVCLHPGRAYLELKARVYNRTPFPQTFLWWANVATRVHEAYQSFFPPDVCYIADHAKRATSEYPLAKGSYYGVNYGERGRNGIPAGEIPRQFIPSRCRGLKTNLPDSTLPEYAANDLSFYANIPVPTSYMCMGSQEDFFGGYDYKAKAGLIHLANHHISPGKKQWTWGNHEFGYAWDRNLTDRNSTGEFRPYIEIMAGVYTDNQPDFSFLQPGETKAWSQYWYPIQKVGPAQQANLDAAISLRSWCHNRRVIVLGVSVTRKFNHAGISLSARGKRLFSTIRTLVPGLPLIKEIKLQGEIAETDLLLRVQDVHGHEIISYQPKPRAKGEVPPPATEPPAPECIRSADELFITGLHLQQYRHATRCPTLYWREALRRDPQDSRCNNALGLRYLNRGEFATAEQHFRHAIARLTLCNANPSDGEPFYNLGLCMRQLGRDDEAYAAFYKACWNQAWMASGYQALAEIDSARQEWNTALEHLEHSLRFGADNLRARDLKAVVLRKLHRAGEAATLLKATLALDPLDWWARHLSGQKLLCDQQAALDLAHDYARAGLFAEAIDLLETRLSAPPKNTGLPDQSWGALPLVHYTLGWLHEKRADKRSAIKHFKAAAALPPDYCFPARLEEFTILETAMRANGKDARAPYYLGNWLYDRRRQDEAIKYWEISTSLDDNYSVVWRNLGIAYFNIRGNAGMARSAYDNAFRANPADARLLYERDQLWKRLRENPARRLRELEKHPALVQQRDDLTVELCALLNQSGRQLESLQLLANRNFQPWEGGEGGPLGQYVRTRLALGREALANCDFSRAADHFQAALTSPANLGEAAHLLANKSDIHYWLGVAYAGLGEEKRARQHWLAAATGKGDFQEMKVRAFSEMTYYTALSLSCLGRRAKAKKLFGDVLAYAQDLFNSPARIDYFATSLPTMLLFDDDLQYRQQTTALFLEAQARVGLDARTMAVRLLEEVLRRDPNHAMASDLLTEISEARLVLAAERNGALHPDLNGLSAPRRATLGRLPSPRTKFHTNL